MLSLDGSFVALVTPYKGGEVDLAKVRELVDFHLESGTQGICPVATTGESPVLSSAEKAAVVKTVVKMCRGKIAVAPGTGTNCTQTTIEATRMAAELGADAALLVTPYYNKPTQEGLFRHFDAVAKAVRIHQILYNVPSRTGVNMLPETVARLAKRKNVVGIKEASGSLEQATRIRNLCDIRILSGEDALTYPLLCLGATGVISVAANIIPKEMQGMCDAGRRGDHAGAYALHARYQDLFKALFLETNPIPVKTAMKFMKKLNGELRLPLCEMEPKNAAALREVLRRYRLA